MRSRTPSAALLKETSSQASVLLLDRWGTLPVRRPWNAPAELVDAC